MEGRWKVRPWRGRSMPTSWQSQGLVDGRAEGLKTYMTGEAFQVKGASQCPDELASQTVAALATDLAAALGLGRLQLLVVLCGVCHGAHGGVGAVLGREALRTGWVVRVQGVGGLSREAIAARVVGVLLWRALAVPLRRRRRVHGRQRLAGGGGRGWGCVGGAEAWW